MLKVYFSWIFLCCSKKPHDSPLVVKRIGVASIHPSSVAYDKLNLNMVIYKIIMYNGKTNKLLMWQLNDTKNVERINKKEYNNGYVLTNMIGTN